MGGLLQPHWKRADAAIKAEVQALREEVASLQHEVASLRGRVRAVENSALATNSRCERLEPRLHRLEAQACLPDMVERTVVPGDEDQESPPKQKICPTCRGTGWDPQHVYLSFPPKPVPCSSCGGRGYIEVVP